MSELEGAGALACLEWEIGDQPQLATIVGLATRRDLGEGATLIVALNEPVECAEARLQIQVLHYVLALVPRIEVSVQRVGARDRHCVVGAERFRMKREPALSKFAGRRPIVCDSTTAQPLLDHVARPAGGLHNNSAPSTTSVGLPSSFAMALSRCSFNHTRPRPETCIGRG